MSLTIRSLACRLLLLASAPGASVLPLSAQQVGPNWERMEAVVQHMRPGTKAHVVGDRMKKKCTLVSATDDALLCATAHSQYTLSRAELKSVKLTRPITSTLVGAGLGLGVGLAVGAIVGHVEDPPQPQSFLDFSDLGRDVITGIGGAVGFLGGGIAGGTTDFLRGPTLYLRTAAATPAPAPKQP